MVTFDAKSEKLIRKKCKELDVSCTKKKGVLHFNRIPYSLAGYAKGLFIVQQRYSK